MLCRFALLRSGKSSYGTEYGACATGSMITGCKLPFSVIVTVFIWILLNRNEPLAPS